MRAVDLFAGWGGFTEGATQAGVDVVWAANHWPLAVSAHAANHPDTEHVCQDLRQADWSALPPYELLLAAPACQGHSEASQPRRRPVHDELRATAWAVVDCADATEPDAIIVENVPAFRRWRLYGVWREALEVLGYHVQELQLNAARFGVPQRRRRLFVVATKSACRIELDERDDEPPFGPCIDWSAEGWRPCSEAKLGAQLRFAKGRRNHGDVFLSQHVTGHPGVPLDQPIRTITAAKYHWCLVRGDEYRYLTWRELARGMAFRDDYQWPVEATAADLFRGIGNAVCPPVARDLVAAVAGCG